MGAHSFEKYSGEFFASEGPRVGTQPARMARFLSQYGALKSPGNTSRVVTLNEP